MTIATDGKTVTAKDRTTWCEADYRGGVVTTGNGVRVNLAPFPCWVSNHGGVCVADAVIVNVLNHGKFGEPYTVKNVCAMFTPLAERHKPIGNHRGKALGRMAYASEQTLVNLIERDTLTSRDWDRTSRKRIEHGVRDYVAEHGRALTLREVADLLNMSMRDARRYLTAKRVLSVAYEPGETFDSGRLLTVLGETTATDACVFGVGLGDTREPLTRGMVEAWRVGVAA